MTDPTALPTVELHRGPGGRLRRAALAVLVASACLLATAPAAAANPICTVTSFFNGALGKACNVASHAGQVVSAGKKLLEGHVGDAIKIALGGGRSVASAASRRALKSGARAIVRASGTGARAIARGGRAAAANAVAPVLTAGGRSPESTALGLAAIAAWVLGGTQAALRETGKVIGHTTTPQLRSTWFSATYWRMATVSAILTLPFLFAAAIQALLRSDLALLLRAAFGYLPLAALAISIAAPLTTLLLSASDELSAVVSSAAGPAGEKFFARSVAVVGALTALSGSPFIAVLIGIFTVSAAVVLWLELLIRDAAVYVIVLMLPMVFAALVWPARRVWAVRAVELLLALILSKFAIVAVLSLGGAALAASAGHSLSGSLVGIVLLTMGAFAPWALMRLIPLVELASGAAGALRGAGGSGLRTPAQVAGAGAEWSDARWGADWAAGLMGGLRRDAEEVTDDHGAGADLPSKDTLLDLRTAERSVGADRSGATRADGGGAPSASHATGDDADPLAAGRDAVAGDPGELGETVSDGVNDAPAHEIGMGDAPDVDGSPGAQADARGTGPHWRDTVLGELPLGPEHPKIVLGGEGDWGPEPSTLEGQAQPEPWTPEGQAQPEPWTPEGQAQPEPSTPEGPGHPAPRSPVMPVPPPRPGDEVDSPISAGSPNGARR